MARDNRFLRGVALIVLFGIGTIGALVLAVRGISLPSTFGETPILNGGGPQIGAPAKGIIRYEDDSGIMHYVTSISQVPAQYKGRVRTDDLPRINVVPIAKEPSRGSPTSKGTERTQPKVEIFVADWCPYCRALEIFLKQEKIRFTRYDIEHNLKGRTLHKKLGGGGIPVTRINNSTVIRGYTPEAIKAAVNQ